MELLLNQKVAIITGGTRGIGKAIAHRFAREGARIALFGRNREAGEQALSEIQKECGIDAKNIHFFKVDVSDLVQVQEGIEQTTQALGPVQILVNNAGITKDQLLMKLTQDDWNAVLETNLTSIFNTSKSVIRSMMKGRYGKIINISSVVGLMGNAGQTNYAAAKAGMLGFTKALAKEVATRNICVNAIAPGFIETDMTDLLNEKQKEAILGQIAMKKLGSGQDIANAVLFLASSLSDYITGQTLTVDGGMVM